MACVTFAAPRFFNAAFQAETVAQQAAGRLHPLRCSVGGDPIARLPPRWLGGSNGLQPHLLLHPPPSAAPRRRALMRAIWPAGWPARLRWRFGSAPTAASSTASSAASSAASCAAPCTDAAERGRAAAAERGPLRPVGGQLGRHSEGGGAMSYRADAADDDDVRGLPSPAFDPHAHTSHALFLSGETAGGTSSRSRTVPWSQPWPLERW